MTIEFKYNSIQSLCMGEAFFLPCCTITDIPNDTLGNLRRLEDPSGRLYLLLNQALGQTNKKIKSFDEGELAAVLLEETCVRVIINNDGHLQLEILGTPTPIELFQKYMTEKIAGNAQTAFTHLFQLANQTHSRFHLTDLGICYEEGLGIPKNLKEAVKCYQLAADQSFPKAQYQLGNCYRYGNGVDIDLAKAYTFYQLAADSANENAEYEVGMCYYTGDGVKRDLGQAFTYFKRSADKGHKIAQYYVGVCYDHGFAVQKNSTKAIIWLTFSAKQGYGYAQMGVGAKYATGEGCRKNLQKAAQYYVLAADQGIPQAQFKIGVCYYAGIGVERDEDQAIHYFKLAADQGHIRAINALSVHRKKIGLSSNSMKISSAPSYSPRGAFTPGLRTSSDPCIVNTGLRRTVSSLSTSPPGATQKSKLSISTIPSGQSQNPKAVSRPQLEIQPIDHGFALGINKLRRRTTDPNYLKNLSASIRMEKTYLTTSDKDDDMETLPSQTHQNDQTPSESIHTTSFCSASTSSDEL